MENQKKPKGGRPKSEAKDKLNSQIGVRFSMADQVKIKLKAEAANMSASDYIRQAAINATVKRPPTPEEMELYRVLAGMANNLNQLTKEAHKQNLPSLSPLILRSLNEINATIKKLQNDS